MASATASAGRLSISGAEPLNPAIDRRVVDCDAAFGHHRFEIPVADRVPAVPAHGPEHDLTAEVASLEITHAATPRSSQRRQFTDSGRFLQQSPPYYLPGYQPFINSVHRHMDDLNLLLIADTHALPTKLRDIIAEHDALKTLAEPISTYADTVETHTRTHQRLTRTDHLHTRHDLQAKYPEWLREADQLVATGKKLLKTTDPTYRALLNDYSINNRIRRAVDSLNNVIHPQGQHRVPAKQPQRQKQATLTKQQSTAKKTQKHIDERPEHDISQGPEIDL